MTTLDRLRALLTFVRATGKERADTVTANRQAELRVARLRHLDLATLRAEHAHWLSLKFLFEGIRDRTPGEQAGYESLRRRVDEGIAELVRKQDEADRRHAEAVAMAAEATPLVAVAADVSGVTWTLPVDGSQAD